VTDQPAVSVVVPTCDRPDLLGRSVASILTQTFDDFEVIIVDDGTHRPVPDGMFDDPRVRIIPSGGAHGPGPARNRGIDAARGEYVAFLDDDDLWLPQKLEASVDALRENPDAGVVFHATGRPGGAIGRGPGQHLHAHPAQMFATRQTPHVDSVVVRRSLFDDVRFSEDLPAAAEVDLFLRLAKISPFVELDATYALFDPSPEAPSRVSVQARIVARRRLMADHPDVFAGREARAFGMMRLGHLYRRSGERGAAIRCFLNGIWLDPFLIAAWRGLFSSSLPPQ
jgi:glycosyltransferase involved in cell wall biosynthesis